MLTAIRNQRRNAVSAPAAHSTSAMRSMRMWSMTFLSVLANEFLNQAGVLRTMFGSWSVSSMFTARTGFPVNLTTSATGPDGNTVAQRPNFVPGQRYYLPGGNFNPAAFCTPGPAPTGNCLGASPSTSPAFGDVPRNFMRGPGVWQQDLALSKHIVVSERLQLQFRAEVFNIFN